MRCHDSSTRTAWWSTRRDPSLIQLCIPSGRLYMGTATWAMMGIFMKQGEEDEEEQEMSPAVVYIRFLLVHLPRSLPSRVLSRPTPLFTSFAFDQMLCLDSALSWSCCLWMVGRWDCLTEFWGGCGVGTFFSFCFFSVVMMGVDMSIRVSCLSLCVCVT
jgi:hypothetical protein